MANKFQSIVAGPYVGAYAWLAKPDQGQQYSDDKFKVTVLIPKSEKKAVAAIRKACETAAKKEWPGSDEPFRFPLVDGDEKDKEEFHGHWMMVCKSKYKPGFIDAKRQELPDGTAPRSGDLIRVACNLIPYIAGGNKGVACQLRNVQLVEQRNMGGNAASDFDEVEGFDGLSPQADAETSDAKSDF